MTITGPPCPYPSAEPRQSQSCRRGNSHRALNGNPSVDLIARQSQFTLASMQQTARQRLFRKSLKALLEKDQGELSESIHARWNRVVLANGFPKVPDARLLPFQSEMGGCPRSDHQDRAAAHCRIGDTDAIGGRAKSHLLLHHAPPQRALASIFR